MYEHREEDDAFPLHFRQRLETFEGMAVQGSEGLTEVDPDDPDTTYHYLVLVMQQGREPDEVKYITRDNGARRIVF